MFSFAETMKGSGEKGIALITVMLMMAIMTILAITMFNTSYIETLLSKNYSVSKEAFYDADAGVQYALAKIQEELDHNYIISLSPIKYNKNIDDLTIEDYSASNQPSMNSHDYNFELKNLVSKDKDDSTYCFISEGMSDNNSRSIIKACFELEVDIHDSFGVGIVSKRNIEISGNVGDEFKASMHANESITQTGGDGGEIKGKVTYANSIFIGGEIHEDYPEPKKVKENDKIPKITQDIFDTYRDIAEDEGHILNHNTTLKDEDLTDNIYFVDGDITLHKHSIVKNTTIIATGNITFNGGCSWDGSNVENIFISGGDINFNGNGEVAGAFWSNGEFIHNGGPKIYGSIVTAGDKEDGYDPDAEFKGGLSFDSSKNIENNFLPVQMKIVNVQWEDHSLL